MGVGKLHSVCDQQTLAIQRCQRGRPEAFEWIVNRYMKQAYSIALGLVGNRDDALELSQEAFYRALRNIDKLKSHSKFFPWFYQILKNLCFTHLRKRVSRSTGNPLAFGSTSEGRYLCCVFKRLDDDAIEPGRFAP